LSWDMRQSLARPFPSGSAMRLDREMSAPALRRRDSHPAGA
jgi:hypothetical protein